MSDRPWYRDFLQLEAPQRLSREEFVARYLPRYRQAYTARTGILTKVTPKGVRVVNTGSGYKSAVARRENRIDEAFNLYLSDYDANLAGGHWVSPEQAETIRKSFTTKS